MSSAIQAENAFGGDQEKKETVEEDVSVIVSSLSFINDLLRNMLDMHRANSNQLQLNPTHTDVLSDILQPVAAMLYRRGENFKVEVECESDDMVIMADKLRLKQIVMNLGRNAVKFVTKGFVRLRAARDLESGYVRIFVEDSGPGIPLEKRSRLFSKFQESRKITGSATGKLFSLICFFVSHTFPSFYSGLASSRHWYWIGCKYYLVRIVLIRP